MALQDFLKSVGAVGCAACALSACSPWAVETRMRIEHDDPSTVLARRTVDLKQTGDSLTYSLVDWDVAEVRSAGDPEPVVLRANNYADGHVVRVDRPGCAPVTVPVFARRPNLLKLGDLAGMAFYAVESGTSREEGNLERSYVAAAWAGVFAGSLTSGPWLLYPRKVSVPPSSRLPQRKEGQPDVRVEEFAIDVAAADHHILTFRTMDDFIRRSVQDETTSLRSVRATPEPLLDRINEALYFQDFLTSDELALFYPADAIALAGRLEGVTEYRVGPFVTYSVKTAWWLHTPYGLPTDSTRKITRSPWAIRTEGAEGWEREVVGEAIASAALTVADSAQVMRLVRPGRDFDAEWRKDWEPLAILPADEVKESAVARSAEAVVTIEALDGHGSGVVIGDDGWILTNWHVVADTTLTYTVKFPGGGTKEARLVRHHPVQDLAVMRVDSTGLPVLPLAARVPVAGETAFAIGAPHSPDLGGSVSHGVVSAFRRDGERPLLQTDASISPGNSGGALVNAAGRLIGIITEKVIDEGVEGVGFAVPVDEVIRALGLAPRLPAQPAQPADQP